MLPEKQNYSVKRIDSDEKANTLSEPEKLEHDPMDTLPDVSSKTAGLPVVTFVLVCVAAFLPTAAVRMVLLAAFGEYGLAAFCAVILAVLLFGGVALVRGMFRRLREQQAEGRWYPISAAVMAAAVVIGVLIGLAPLLG